MAAISLPGTARQGLEQCGGQPVTHGDQGVAGSGGIATAGEQRDGHRIAGGLLGQGHQGGLPVLPDSPSPLPYAQEQPGLGRSSVLHPHNPAPERECGRACGAAFAPDALTGTLRATTAR